MSMALLLSMALLTPMVELPAGEVRPLYLTKDSPLTPVAPFQLDVTPVTNQQFAAFVAAHSQWQQGRPMALFAEPAYLQHWPGQIPSPEQAQQPVIFVSWFAADAYCRAQGKRLPTVAEWEYAAQASQTAAFGATEPGFTRHILNWYARPATARLSAVGQSPANYWQVHDLHGLVWEWTQDFNSALVTGESRGDSSLDQGLFCGSASAGSADPSDYAAFMRYGFRSSLKATYALGNLGFRCAKEISHENLNAAVDAVQP
ncbi:formylglycine-generating enzyme family protein [Oceanimonas smirnovii]|uniref:formylglycine-generating enzyme family protein n=1 Tax=Oceanimonas smirnovii TaxID=264574 RepID=UPI00376F5B13